MDVRRIDSIKDGTNVVGNRTRVKVVKNKMAPPFKVVEFDIMYGEGISSMGCLLDAALNLDLVQKTGSWYSYQGEKIGQGREKAVDFLKRTPDIAVELDAKIRASMMDTEE